MDWEDVLVTIGIVILGVAFICIIIIWMRSPENEAIQEELRMEQERIVTEQAQCEHEFVTVSDYNIIFDYYKIYQKCTKCGYEVK